MPNPAQCKSVQAFWDSIDCSLQTLGGELLATLFADSPDVEKLFGNAVGNKPNQQLARETHGAKIMRKLDVCVGQLDTPDILADDLRTLGARHPAYGVIPNRHNRPFRNALFAVLKKHGKTNFDEAAWVKTFDLVMGCMGLFSDN